MSAGVDALMWQLKAANPTLASSAVAEYRFHPERRFRFDLAWVGKRVAIEVDGGSWIGGRHTSGIGFERDAEKQSLAAVHGWRVLHCTPRQIEDGKALTWLLAALQ